LLTDSRRGWALVAVTAAWTASGAHLGHVGPAVVVTTIAVSGAHLGHVGPAVVVTAIAASGTHPGYATRPAVSVIAVTGSTVGARPVPQLSPAHVVVQTEHQRQDPQFRLPRYCHERGRAVQNCVDGSEVDDDRTSLTHDRFLGFDLLRYDILR
jgi:hypothetical protein